MGIGKNFQLMVGMEIDAEVFKVGAATPAANMMRCASSPYGGKPHQQFLWGTYTASTYISAHIIWI